ncbi:MAG: hypothetical protein ACRDU5_23435 [Mycobacterium sp.]
MKRTNTKDVFEQLAEHDDPPDTETPNNTSETEAGEATEAPAQDDDDAEATKSSEPGEDASHETPASSRGHRLLRRLLVVAAGVVVVAALALSGFLGWQLKQREDTAAAGRAALAVAQSYAVTLTSVDNKNIDGNFAEVLNGATGEFKDMYSQSASQLRQVLIDNKAMSTGTVVDSAIKSATKTKVEVLLFIDQSISNVVNPDPRIDRSRVRMTMELVDNHWLASKVDIT